jgi:hypothetical protein
MSIEEVKFISGYSVDYVDRAIQDALCLCMPSRVVYLQEIRGNDLLSRDVILKRAPEDPTVQWLRNHHYSWGDSSRFYNHKVFEYIDDKTPQQPYLLRNIQIKDQVPGKFTVSFSLAHCTTEEAKSQYKSMHPQHAYLEILYKKLCRMHDPIRTSAAIGEEIPFWFDGGVNRKRQLFLTAKLLFLLAGEVEIHPVDDLQMLSLEYIEQNREELKYLTQESMMAREYNGDDPVLPASDLPIAAQIKQRIPRIMSIGRLISLFGLYVSGEYPQTDTPQILYCPKNIYRFAAKAETLEGFEKYLFPVDGIAGSAPNALCEILQSVTLAHELGHHVFRQVKSGPQQDKETLANWFASVLLGDYERKLIRGLRNYQPSIYKNVIPLPGSVFTEEPYASYCEKVLALMKEVGK